MDDDLIFVDSAEEALLPRGYTLPKKRPRGPRPTVSGVRRKRSRNRRSIEKPRRKVSPRQRIPVDIPRPPRPQSFIGIPEIIKMLNSPAPDVVRHGLQVLRDMSISPEGKFRIREITERDMSNLIRLLEKHATRRNPAPIVSIPSLARQTLVKLRRARHEVGGSVFQNNPRPMPMQWVFRDGTMLPFQRQPRSRKPQRRRY